MSAELLEKAIALAQAGKQQEARELLAQVITADVHNEKAWLLYANVLPDEDDRIKALEECLHHNPSCEAARQALVIPRGPPLPTKTAEPPFTGQGEDAVSVLRFRMLTQSSPIEEAQSKSQASGIREKRPGSTNQESVEPKAGSDPMPINRVLVQERGVHHKGRTIQDGMKKCPYCAEHVQGEAIVCRFCGREFDADTTGQMQDLGKTETINGIKKVQARLAKSEGRLRECERELREVQGRPGHGLVVIVLSIVFIMIWPHLAIVGWLLMGLAFIAIVTNGSQVSKAKETIEHTEHEIAQRKAELAELQARLIAW